MSARAEAELLAALERARAARAEREVAVGREREATVTFMDEALAHGWSWERVGEALKVSGTGARRYYERNRRRVRTI